MGYALGAAFALAAADMFVKLAAGKLPDSLGMLLYGVVPFATGLAWFLADRDQVDWTAITPRTIAYAFAVGVMFTLVTFAMYAAFRHGAPISRASPMIRLGGLVLASIVGLLFWKEPASARYISGVALACAGIYLMISK